MYEFQDQKYYKKEDDTIDEKDEPLTKIISVKLPYQLQYTKGSTTITQDIVFKLDYVVAI